MATIADTHTVDWAVSATPKVSLANTNGVNTPTATIHENIRRTLGGSGTADTAGAIDFGGVTDGNPNYLQGTTAGADIGDADSTFIWVKHTGYQWGGNATTLGAVSSDNLHIKVGSEVCAVLKPGEGMVFPLHGAQSGSAWKAFKAAGTDIAVEAIGLD